MALKNFIFHILQNDDIEIGFPPVLSTSSQYVLQISEKKQVDLYREEDQHYFQRNLHPKD